MPFHIFRVRTVTGANVVGLLLGAVIFANFFLLRVYAKWRKTYSKTYSEWAGALSGFLPQISGFEAGGLRPQTARRSRAVLCSQEALHAGAT